jgi:hypothetical protein
MKKISRSTQNRIVQKYIESKYGKQNTLFGDAEDVFYDTDKLYKRILKYLESRLNIDILKEMKVNLKDFAETIYDLYIDYISFNPKDKRVEVEDLLDKLIEEELLDDYTISKYFTFIVTKIENIIEDALDEKNLLEEFKDDYPKNEVLRNMDIQNSVNKSILEDLRDDRNILISELEKYILKTKPNLIYAINDSGYNLISIFEEYKYVHLPLSLIDAINKSIEYFYDQFHNIQYDIEALGELIQNNSVLKIPLDMEFTVQVDYKVIDAFERDN